MIVVMGLVRSLNRILSQSPPKLISGPLFYKDAYSLYGSQQDKTNKIICAPREDSDHPGLPPSLIRSAQWKAEAQCFFMRTVKTLIRLGGCLG